MSDGPTTVLNQITSALEEHNKMLLSHRQYLGQILEDVGEIKQRLGDLEAASSLDSSDTKFLIEMSDRLTAITATLEKKN
jgi:hypothetical protein